MKMKNLYPMALVGAFALTFAACSSDDDNVADVNPTYDGESVKTTLTLNIQDVKNTTRMSADNTQNSSNFLGIQDIYLIPTAAEATESTELPFKILNLENIAASALSASASNKLYKNQSIAIGVNNFLFYGKAIQTYATEGAPTQAEKFAQGYTTNTLATTLTNTSAILFNAAPIQPATAFASGGDIYGKQTTLAGYLNNIAGANITSPSTKTWASTTSESDAKWQELANAYTKFTTRLHAGSSQAILFTIQDLWDNMNNAIAVSADATVIAIAEAVKTAITADGFTETSGVISWTNTENSNFPASFGLPEGSMQLTFASSTFSYQTEPKASSLNVYNIIYPNQLYYFDNTPLKATDTALDDDNWAKTPANWDTFDDNWGASGTYQWYDAVKTSTRSIALRNNVNYGSALMKTTVTSNADNYTDNAQSIAGATNNQTITANAAGFPLTGLLIGGQPTQVGWQFVSKATDNFTQTVYDNAIPSGIAAKKDAVSADNYTLLFDNYTTAASQPKVYIAAEFTNNTKKDFYGHDGLIKAGQKFYLVGELDPSTVSSYDAFPTAPYRNASTDKRVFMQDYTTTVKLTLAATSLQNAYVTIPDLRPSQLTIGLSVDLAWKSGLEFNVNL